MSPLPHSIFVSYPFVLIFLFYLCLLLSLPHHLPGFFFDKAKGKTGQKEAGEEEREQGKWKKLRLREIRRGAMKTGENRKWGMLPK
jgi:hypothetical protein